MKNVIILSIIFFTLTQNCFPGDADSIKAKIVDDDGYIWNVKYTKDIPGEVLLNETNKFKKARNIPIFKENENIPGQITDYNYRIYYSEIKGKITPLEIKQLMTVTKNQVSITREDTVFSVVDFKRMYDEKDPAILKDNLDYIYKLIDMIAERKAGAQETFKFYNVNIYSKKTFDKNQYYTDFEGIVKNHNYVTKNSSDFYLEFSFPGLGFSISNNFIDIPNLYFLKNFGFEFGLQKDNILNLLEFQNPVLNFGFHSYFAIYDNLFVDFKFLGQKKYNNKNLISGMKAWPVFDFERVKINKASGVAVDAHLLGSLGKFKLPFINIYLSHANVDFKNPVFSGEITSKIRQSYYSLNQLEVSFSFYWNTDNDNINKFRLDIGGGSYDIYRVLYDKNNNVISDKEINNFVQWLPVFALNYIHSSNDTKFGSSARYFDNRINFGLWLKFVQIGNFEVRIQEYYISDSFSNTVKEWEYDGSSNMMQFVFRYGLK